MNESIASRFPLPPRRPAGPHAFDLSAKALRQWLAALPLGSPELCATRLLEAVQEVNRLEAPDQERLDFLEQIGGIAHTVTETLHKALLDVTAPPRKREMERAEAAILLHQELALAYRGAQECLAGRGRFRRPGAAALATQMQRAMHHLRQSLKVHYLIKALPAESLWQRLGALYAMGREAEVLTLATEPLPGRPAETLEDTFKQVLLLALASPAALRGSELDALARLLPALAPLTRLLPVRDSAETGPVFLVGLYGGMPPGVYPGADCRPCGQGEECLELDVQPLLAELRTRLETGRAEGPEGGGERRQLRRLYVQLGRQRRRRTHRIPSGTEMEVVAGLREVHRYLTEGEGALAPLPAPVPEVQAARPNIQYNVLLNLELVHIETPAYRGSDADEPLDPFSGERVEVRYARCRALNFSSGGYCLATRDLERFRLRAGEPVAVREMGETRWLPGAVAWVTSDGSQVNFGVRLLAPQVQPGKVICRGGPQTQASECLFLLDTPGTDPARILLSPRCLRPGTELSAEAGGRSFRLVLGNEQARTLGYVEHACLVSDTVEDYPETTPLFGEPPTAPAAPAPGPAEPAPAAAETHRRPWKRFF